MVNNNQEYGQVITFYSYKGGTGRTMALANVACLLAQQQQENNGAGVLMIDWDLEAPGLHRYFRDQFNNSFGNTDNPEQAFDEFPGLIDLFEALEAEVSEGITEQELRNIIDQLLFNDFIIKTDITCLSFIKAGRFNENYEERVTVFDWVSLFNNAQGLFTILAEHLTKRFKYILIDSRTGMTDISNICTKLLPEKLVVVFTPNRQSLTGLSQLIRDATKYRKSNDERSFAVFPLPSRIELSESSLKEDWRLGNLDKKIDGYQPIFEKLFREVYNVPECKLQAYFDEVQIQQSTRYAYGEDIAVLIERTRDSLSLYRSYERFVKYLLINFPWEMPPVPEFMQVAPGISIPVTRLNRPEIIEIETLSSEASNLRKSHDMLRALVASLRTLNRVQQVEMIENERKRQTEEKIPNNVKRRAIERLVNVTKNIREKNRLEGHGDDVWDIDIHCTGELIISASQDRTLKLWKLDGTLLVNFIGHKDRIRAVSFNPVLSWIASASDDRTVKLWHFDGKCEQTFKGHRDHVLGVCFSPDGQIIASASADR